MLRRFFFGSKLHERFFIFIFLFRKGSAVWTNKRLAILRRHPVLGHELDMMVFVAKEQKLHVSSGEPTAHATWAGTQDSSNPTHKFPLWNIELEKSTSRKLDV